MKGVLSDAECYRMVFDRRMIVPTMDKGVWVTKRTQWAKRVFIMNNETTLDVARQAGVLPHG